MTWVGRASKASVSWAVTAVWRWTSLFSPRWTCALSLAWGMDGRDTKGWRRKAAISEGQASESVHPRGSFTEDIRSRGFCALHMKALTSGMWRTLAIPCLKKQFAAGSPSARGRRSALETYTMGLRVVKAPIALNECPNDRSFHRVSRCMRYEAHCRIDLTRRWPIRLRPISQPA